MPTNIMKHKLLISSLVCILVGFIIAKVGDSLSTIGQDGISHDSRWILIGTLLVVIGLLELVIVGVWYAVDYLKKRG